MCDSKDEPLSYEDDAALTILENSCSECREKLTKQSIPPAKNSLELALARRRMAFLRLFSTICPLERSGVDLIANDNIDKLDAALDELFDAHSSVTFHRSG